MDFSEKKINENNVVILQYNVVFFLHFLKNDTIYCRNEKESEKD